MQRVVVNMQSFVFSDAVRKALKDDGDFNVTAVNDPQEVVDQCQLIAANLVLMEVTGDGSWTMEKRLHIRNELQKTLPECKIVLFVNEKLYKKIAIQIKQAKRDGLIDQFIFGSTSAEFMVALLDTL